MTSQKPQTIPGQLTLAPDGSLTVPASLIDELRAYTTVAATMPAETRGPVLDQIASLTRDLVNAATPTDAPPKPPKPTTADDDAYLDGFRDALDYASTLERGIDDHNIGRLVKNHLHTHGIHQWRLAQQIGLGSSPFSARVNRHVPWTVTDVLRLAAVGVNVGITTPPARDDLFTTPGDTNE